MAIFFTLVSHTMIIASLLGKVYLIVMLITASANIIERMLRGTAVSCALMLYYGATATNLSLSGLALEAISSARPLSFGLLAIILPGMSGSIVAWYVIKTMHDSRDIAIRILILVGSLIVLQFGDVYVQAFYVEEALRTKALLPNLAFTLGIALYSILRYRTEE